MPVNVPVAKLAKSRTAPINTFRISSHDFPSVLEDSTIWEPYPLCNNCSMSSSTGIWALMGLTINLTSCLVLILPITEHLVSSDSGSRGHRLHAYQLPAFCSKLKTIQCLPQHYLGLPDRRPSLYCSLFGAPSSKAHEHLNIVPRRPIVWERQLELRLTSPRCRNCQPHTVLRVWPNPSQ